MDQISNPPLKNPQEPKISPSILLIIFILSIIFFISGLLHLLLRFLLNPTPRHEETDSNNTTSLQGQLQDLFHLHDSGVDQSFIDTLPIFLYKSIIGSKDPFDCAVCLSQFEPHDRLRFLPNCGHAFHVECIDTWLLSHSTCPLCRRSLFGEFNPVVVVIDSGRSEGIDDELEEDEKVVSIRLGKFRNFVDDDDGDVDDDVGEGSRKIGGNERRCFSMGSCEYVMDERCVLRVPIAFVMKNDGFGKKESFSFSKTWLRGRGGGVGDSLRRGFSFRSPLRRVLAEEVGVDDGEGSCGNGLGSQIEKTPSFARRTLLWIVGRQNKGLN